MIVSRIDVFIITLWSAEIFANYFGHISELHIGDLVLQNHATKQSVKEAVFLRGKKRGHSSYKGKLTLCWGPVQPGFLYNMWV